MTTSPSSLSLHSFHININVGDSSIHLLVDESKVPPEIHKAVLIDGGKNHQDQTDKLRAVIKKIEDTHTFAENGNFNNNLRFDAVVITHWDDDHYGGILGLLFSSFQKAIAEHPYIKGLLSATNDKIDKLEGVNTNVSGLQCPIFKYSSYSATPPSVFSETAEGDAPDQNRPEDVLRDDLLTTVYVPYMAGEREVIGNGVKTKKAKKEIVDESSVGGSKCTWCKTKYGQKRYGAQMFSNDQSPYHKLTNDNTFGVRVYFDHDGRITPFRFWYTAKLVAYFDHYLGVELFYGLAPPINHTLIQNPGQLIKAHSLTIAQGPRMYVVAGDQMIIGNTSLGSSSATTSTIVAFNVAKEHKAKEIRARHGIEHVVNVTHGALGEGEPFDERESSESINSASLSVVVFTSRTNTPTAITTTDEQASFSVQHYMAGDAIWDVEDGIARWLRNKTMTWFVESPFMKLSHHGASYSTPSSILAALIPKYIVSPSGNSSVYGHPRPEILFWLHAMTVAMATGKLSGNKTMKLLMYNWPVWFTTSAWDAPYFLLNFLYEPSDEPSDKSEKTPSPEVVYLKAMQKLYTGLSKSPLTMWWELGLSKVTGNSPKDKVAKKDAIIQIYAALRPYVSAILDQQFADFAPGIRVLKCVLSNNKDGTYSAGVDTWDDALAVKTLYTRTPVLTAASTIPATGPPTTPSTAPASTTTTSGTSSNPSGGGDGSSNSNGNTGGAMTVEPSQPATRRRNGVRVKTTRLDAPVASDRVTGKRAGPDAATSAVPAMEQMITDGEVEQPADFDEESGAPAVQYHDGDDTNSGRNGDGQGGGHAADPNAMPVEDKLHTVVAHPKVRLSSMIGVVPKDVTVSNGSNTLALRSEVVTRDVASTAPSGPMFLCGSDFDPFTPTTSEDGTFEIPLEAGSFNDFISLLGQGCIKLASQWNTNADGTQSASVSSEDEWMTSLVTNGLGVTGLVLTGSNDTSQAHVTAIAATVTVAGVLLTFTSAQSQVVANSSPPTSPPPPPPATVPAPPPPIATSFLPDYALLSLGLASPTSQSLKVSDVLAAFAPTWLAKGANGLLHLPGFDSLSDLQVTLSASAGSRNQLSLRCDGPYTSWLRLKFDFDVSALKSAFSNAFPFLMSSSDFAITNVSLCALKETMNPIGYIGPSIKNRLSLEVEITLGGTQKSADTLDIQAWIVFGETTTQFVLRFDPNADKGKISRYMARFIDLGDNQASTLQPNGGSSEWLPNTNTVSFEVLQASLLLNNPKSARGFSIQQLVTEFEVDVYSALFHVRVSWTSGVIKLMGKLWTKIPPDFSTYALVPFYEPYDIITPKIISDSPPTSPSRSPPQGFVGLTQLLSNASPSGNDSTGTVALAPDKMQLQPHITDLEVSAEKNGSEIVLTFTGSIGSTVPDSPPEAPKIVLGNLALQCYYSSIHGYDIQFINTTYLLPRDFPASSAAALQVSVEYSKEDSAAAWKVTGTASNLNFASLFALFDPDASHAVMDILEDFAIPNLYVEWDYSSGSADLSAMGSLIFGPFELDFTYTYDSQAAAKNKSGTNNWLFKASLGPKGSDSVLLSDLIGELTDDASIASAMADVPFVSSIEIPAAKADNGDDPPIQLCVTKAVGGETVLWLMLSIVTEAGTISFTYVQMQEARSAPAAGTSNADATKNGPTGYKRIFRVMLDKLPTLPNIPVIGQIDQPFDAIDYVFVSDSTPGVTSGGGFTTDELDLINGTMSAADQIPFRASKSDLQSSSPNNAAKENPAVLLPGHHFILTADHVVVLDHIFGNKPSPPPTDGGASSKVISKIPKQTAVSGQFILNQPITKASLLETPAEPANTALTTDSGSTNGAMNKTLGILTIKSIGLQCKDGYLYILISATIMLGPIQLSLEGFGVGVQLSMLKLNELKNLTIHDFSMILSGMSVYFNAPPVMIAGVFVHEDTSAYEAYKGGLAVSILPYTLLAVGEYKHTFNPDFKSVFVFARLDGPLFTLEFAAISGVEAGFGYNYQLATPAPKDVSSFPLVHGVTAEQQNPMDTLTQFDTYNSVARDSMWFAIGFKVDAFEILTVDAAAILQFGPSSTKINIIAIASASMPPKATERKEMFVYVELGMTASLDILGGTLQLSAALTPNSFLLYPDCHLTGGFAIWYWFAGSPYAGDWVFTIGGYHPAFKPPTYYPDVDRLAINWNLSDVLTITGQSFFAITPKAVMGGGRLQAVFNAGPIYADFEAWASFLMTLKPFYFIADIGVSVSVGFHCDIGIIHINISADIGASLHLQGPPFGGVVYVDLWIHKFSIYFGDQNNAPAVLNWDQFVEVVLQQRGTDASASSSALAVVAIEQGSANEKTTSSQQKTGDKWFVRCGSFQFRVESKIPINDMILTNEVTTWKASEQVTIPPPSDLEYAAYARLMHATGPLISDTAHPEYGLRLNLDIAYPVKPDSGENPLRLTPIIRNMPNALWDKYDAAEDPNSSGNNISSILSPDPSKAPTTRPLLTGFTISAPLPRLPAMNIPEFNATDAMSEGVFQDGGTPSKTAPSRPLLPIDSNNVDERPCLPQTADEQTVGRPKTPSATPWSDIVTDWRAADDVRAQGVVNAWSALCGWGRNAPPAPATTDTAAATTAANDASISVAGTIAAPFVPLTVKKPKKELGLDGLDTFAKYFVGCPFVSTAVV